MRKIFLSLVLTLFAGLSLSAQSSYYPFFERPEGFIVQGTRIYSLGGSFVQGLGFNEHPSSGVLLEQSPGISFNYTTAFAQMGRFVVSSESEITYRTITELYGPVGSDQGQKHASISGLTGLGFYYNVGSNMAIYVKGLLGLGTGYAGSASSTFTDLFNFEARAGLQVGIGRHFSAFGDVGYGKDFFRVGLSLRH